VSTLLVEFIENFSENRDRANKMESTELRTTLSIHVCASPPGHDSLIAMPNQRVAWHQREALQIAIKLRLG
jgi:hypothetical protein